MTRTAGAVAVELAAPEATGLGAIAVERLDTLLDTTLRDLRGDFSLVLAGALAEAVGGAVTLASSPESGLVLALQPRGRVNLALTRPHLDGKQAVELDLPRGGAAPTFLDMDGVERVSGTRLLFRFGIGATELAGKRMITALQAVDAVLASAAAEPVPPGALELRHALLGAMAALPAWARAALARRQAGARSLRDGIARGHRLASRLPGAVAPDDGTTPGSRAWTRSSCAGRWRGAVRSWPAARWPARRSACATQELVSAVAESPELKRVIAEQSEGLGASAMTDLREGSARADTLAERVTRRFLRRSR